jgi:sugar O-acyltransferase (sialic acid O-acetyltransferase NeuD family)
MRVVVLGAGGHAQVTADILLVARAAGGEYEPIGFLDDDPALRGRRFLGLEVLGRISELQKFTHDALIVAIGENCTRARIFHAMLAQGERMVNAVHPSAVLATDVVLGRGVMICARAVVNPTTSIGDNVILNTGCTVDHHNVIGSHAHVAPGAHTGGNVRIGDGAFLGIGAVVIPGCAVGEWAVVGGGAAVVRDIPPHTTAVGVPARVIKRHEVEESCRGN